MVQVSLSTCYLIGPNETASDLKVTSASIRSPINWKGGKLRVFMKCPCSEEFSKWEETSIKRNTELRRVVVCGSKQMSSFYFLDQHRAQSHTSLGHRTFQDFPEAALLQRLVAWSLRHWHAEVAEQVLGEGTSVVILTKSCLPACRLANY